MTGKWIGRDDRGVRITSRVRIMGGVTRRRKEKKMMMMKKKNNKKKKPPDDDEDEAHSLIPFLIPSQKASLRRLLTSLPPLL